MGGLPGAARYIGHSEAATCKRCGAGHLAWHKSAKTGRWYLCNTQGSQSENASRALNALVVMPWSPHRCKTAEELAREDWEMTLRQLQSQGCDLLLAGRVEEFVEFQQDVIYPHLTRQATP